MQSLADCGVLLGRFLPVSTIPSNGVIGRLYSREPALFGPKTS